MYEHRIASHRTAFACADGGDGVTGMGDGGIGVCCVALMV